MKFKKFAKSLAPSEGVLVRSKSDPDDSWLTDGYLFMRVPMTVQAVTTGAVMDMPMALEQVLDEQGIRLDAVLTRAVMTVPDGKIADVSRIYTTIKGQSISISNRHWDLIEKNDMCQILYNYDIMSETENIVALLVYEYPKLPGSDVELAGVIFPGGINIE